MTGAELRTALRRCWLVAGCEGAAENRYPFANGAGGWRRGQGKEGNTVSEERCKVKLKMGRSSTSARNAKRRRVLERIHRRESRES